MPAILTAAGIRLHYESVDLTAPWVDAPETIVLHHGIGAHSDIWREWMPALLTHYRIVTFDMRGSGRSSPLPVDAVWSMDALVGDVFAVADAVGAPRFHLVGESIGGTVALRCALDEPERVLTLSISNGADIGATLRNVERWQDQLDREGVKAWSDQFMRDRFHPGALDPARREWYARQQCSWKPEVILNALRVLVGTDLRDRVRDVACPVLLMHGDGSPFIPVAIMTDMHRRFRDSRLQIFAGARHGLPYSHARECSLLLREFLAGRVDAVPSPLTD